MASNKIYPYAVAAVRSMENKLLTKDQLILMAEAKTAEESIKMLSETEYGKDRDITIYDFDKVISDHMSGVYTSVGQLMASDGFVSVFLFKNDYHNLKVLIKSELSGKDPEPLLVTGGTIKLEKLRTAFRERKFNEIASLSVDAVNEAYDLYAKTKNARYIDFVLDKACFKSMKTAADKTNIKYVVDYVAKLADITNIKTLYRISAFNLDTDLMELAYVEGGRISIDFFKKAVTEVSPIERIKETEYKALVEGTSASAFEKDCDDYLMSYIKDAKYKSLTPEPVIGYVLAKETEAKVLRMILSCKVNGIDSVVIKERVRETYV